MLTRWDPYREMVSLRDAMDRLFENAFTGQVGDGMGNMGLALDVIERGDEFVVKTSLPGVSPEDIDVTYSNGVLTIQAEVKEDEEDKDAQYHLRERRWGRFSRSITIPRVDPDQIQASYENGCLTLRLPKAEDAKPRRISVQSESARKILEG